MRLSNQKHAGEGSFRVRLFDLKRFAINDGPGIRTTLFLKGCPLHCVWCHNPEGISPAAEKLYNRKKCIGCRTCIDICQQKALHLTPDGIVEDPALCTSCRQCTETCPTLALQMAGRDWTLEEVMKEVEKERLVMKTSGGGVTLCGGEPLMQPESTLTLLHELGQRGFHRCLDTTLYCSASVLERILPQCDLLLIDLKHIDGDKHTLYTGIDNKLILDNIRIVSERAIPFWIRIPFIDGINADEDNVKATANFLSHLPHQPLQVNLLPYHDIGKGKHERLGSTYNPDHIPMATPTQDQLQRAMEIFSMAGLQAKIGG